MWLFWQRRSRRERELERELQNHLDCESEDQREAGLSDEDARYAAKRALGNQSLTKENVRAAWGWTFAETLAQDLRYAFRSLRGSPVFALVAIVSLGLGIGANTAIFSFVNALLLKQLPVREPGRLVGLAEYENGQAVNSVFSLPVIAELDRRNHAFDGIFGRYPVRVSLTSDSTAEPIKGELVTGKYFTTLEVKPAIGRLLTEEDISAGTGNPVCVISYSLWQRRFGGDSRIMGRKLLLNARPYSVVGVTEPGFFGPQLQTRIDIQLPISRMGDFIGGFFSTGAGAAMWKSPGFSWLEPLARLKPGITTTRAQAMIDPLARAIRAQVADQEEAKILASRRSAFRLSDGSQGVNVDSTYSRPVTILMGVVGLVLLIACANLANLLIARASARAKEFAVRLSLGASRGRLVRQLMVESVTIACCGGLVGLALAFWIIHSLLLYLNAGRSVGDGLQVALDPMVICFSIALSLLTALVFGLAPAWQSSKTDVVPELKGPAAHSSRIELRRLLIVTEIALSMVILFAAGLMTRTLSKLKTIDLGFDPVRVITLRIDPAMSGYLPDQIDRIFDEVLERIRAQPDIAAASLSAVTPLEGGGMISLDFEVPGHVPKSSDVQTNFNMVSPEYFKTLNQAMLSGRDFNERDVKKASKVAIVNQLFANQYMPGESPIGRHLKMGRDDVQIVGFVKNSHYQTLREELYPLIYLPVKQTQSSGFFLLVQTRVTPKQAIAEIEHAVRTVDAKLPIYGMQKMEDLIDEGITSERMLTFLATLFSGLVTLLCSMGVYGLIAYTVSRRTREIGVRFAIGAQKDDVARLFLRESAVLIGAGVVVGVPLALTAARVLKSLLFGVAADDALTLTATVVIFIFTGLAASVLPVMKATRIEPTVALRYE